MLNENATAGCELSFNSLKVLRERYLLHDHDGAVIETPDGLFHRVAGYVASAETVWNKNANVKQWEATFFYMMRNLFFLPNSPALMNAGTACNQLSACFVLPVQDSLKDIFTTLKNAALIQQSGGGTGFNFSNLRPVGDRVTATGGTAAGPVAFMKIFDTATAHVKQAGRRRGANMGILNISHPDIERFITVKKEQSALSNFNISVGITDDFMHAVEANENWKLVHPGSKQVLKTIKATYLWNLIVEAAWQCGDPGLIFLDTITEHNPTPLLGTIESTNPCGEIPLLPYEPCNLGSINLTKFIQCHNGVTAINWHQLGETVRTAIRFLDDVIEVNDYVIPEVKTMALGNRKVGLGVMGWADTLVELGLPYDSDEAVLLAEKLMKFIQHRSNAASVQLAAERGVFPNWDKSIYHPHLKIRNATRTAIAPTGSISIIADVSPSVEPLFALAYQRQQVLNGTTLFYTNRAFTKYLERDRANAANIMRQVEKEGTAANIPDLPADIKRLFKTALQIAPVYHLKHQVAFQKYTDNAVSKTINLPQSAAIKDVDEIFKTAWRLKARGITVFRNQSAVRQVMEQGLVQKDYSCKVCME